MGDSPRVPQLGVGLAYQEALRPFIESSPGAFDFLEVVPDIIWTDLGPERHPRYVEDPEAVAFLNRVHARMRVVPHSIGLSIGSAHQFNLDHVEQIARWHRWLGFPWHSDHFAYNMALAQHTGGEVNVGLTMPLPFDRETLDLLVSRVAAIRKRIPVPFLLENNVYYFDLIEGEMDEADFFNTLCEQSGCWLIMDLHNVYVNSRNHPNFDPIAFLERVNLDYAVELHVAGGMEYDGFYLDAHSGPIPPAVWDLLERALPRCPNLGGVVFELLGSWFGPMGEERLAAELGRMRELWLRYQQPARRERP